MLKVFISHAHEDLAVPCDVRDFLRNAGHEVFLDFDPHDGMVVGEQWRERLYERLRWADAMVCVVTSAYRTSVWCTAEVNEAQSRGCRVLPLLAEPDVTHPLLDGAHYADYQAHPAKARAALLRALEHTSARKSLRARMTTKPGVVLTVTVIGILIAGPLLWNRAESSPGSSPTCDEIGVAHDSVDGYRMNRQAWLDAYHAAGGRDKLGCPVPVRAQGLVHKWGRGMSQDLADEQNGQTRLMALDTDKVIVMTGTYWTDYTRPHNQLAAGLQGYPVADPVNCGNARVVRLEGGDLTPAAMVSTPAERFVWLPRPMWLRYLELGGPQGPLGRPLNPLDEDVEGVIEFENGSSIEMRDRRITVNHDNAKTIPPPTSSASCPP